MLTTLLLALLIGNPGDYRVNVSGKLYPSAAQITTIANGAKAIVGYQGLNADITGIIIRRGAVTGYTDGGPGGMQGQPIVDDTLCGVSVCYYEVPATAAEFPVGGEVRKTGAIPGYVACKHATATATQCNAAFAWATNSGFDATKVNTIHFERQRGGVIEASIHGVRLYAPAAAPVGVVVDGIE